MIALNHVLTIYIIFEEFLLPTLGVTMDNCTYTHGEFFMYSFKHYLVRLILLTVDIRFIQQPENTKVCLNRTAYFSCHYIGTNVRPHWMINLDAYASSSLPPNTRYEASSGTLVVDNVKNEQNNNTYQCFFPFLRNGCAVLSSVGRLQVHNEAPGKVSIIMF